MVTRVQRASEQHAREAVGSAGTIYATVGDIGRFRNARMLAAYA